MIMTVPVVMLVTMTVPMTVSVVVAVAVGGSGAEGAAEQRAAGKGDQASAGGAEPWKQARGNDRGAARHQQPEDKDAQRVGHRDGEAQGEDVAQPAAAAADRLGGHDGLAMARGKRVDRAKHDRDEQGEQRESQSQVA